MAFDAAFYKTCCLSGLPLSDKCNATLIPTLVRNVAHSQNEVSAELAFPLTFPFQGIICNSEFEEDEETDVNDTWEERNHLALAQFEKEPFGGRYKSLQEYMDFCGSDGSSRIRKKYAIPREFFNSHLRDQYKRDFNNPNDWRLSYQIYHTDIYNCVVRIGIFDTLRNAHERFEGMDCFDPNSPVQALKDELHEYAFDYSDNLVSHFSSILGIDTYLELPLIDPGLGPDHDEEVFDKAFEIYFFSVGLACLGRTWTGEAGTMVYADYDNFKSYQEFALEIIKLSKKLNERLKLWDAIMVHVGLVTCQLIVEMKLFLYH